MAINNSHLQLRLCTVKCVSLYNTRYAKSTAVIGYRYREHVQCTYIYIMSPFFLPEDEDGTTGAGIPSTTVDFFSNRVLRVDRPLNMSHKTRRDCPVIYIHVQCAHWVILNVKHSLFQKLITFF